MYHMICWFLIAAIICAPSCFIDRSYTSYLSLICRLIFAYLSRNNENTQNKSNSLQCLNINEMKLERQLGNLNNRSLFIIMSFYFPQLQYLRMASLNLHKLLYLLIWKYMKCIFVMYNLIIYYKLHYYNVT